MTHLLCLICLQLRIFLTCFPQENSLLMFNFNGVMAPRALSVGIIQKPDWNGFKSSRASHCIDVALIIPSSLPIIALKNLQSSWIELESAFLKSNLDFLCYALYHFLLFFRSSCIVVPFTVLMYIRSPSFPSSLSRSTTIIVFPGVSQPVPSVFPPGSRQPLYWLPVARSRLFFSFLKSGPSKWK